MRTNGLRARLRAGQATIGTHVFLDSPTVVETIGQTGAFDYVEFLAEYAPYDLHRLDDFCRAAELHGLGSMIKVDFGPHRFWAQRSVGAGFESVLFADARSAEDVEGFVKSVRADTPGAGGLFGVGARRHAMPSYGGTERYVEALNDIVVAVMIEKAGAVQQLEAILEVPGIDMIQWGPADYAMSIGKPGQAASDEVQRVERIVIEKSLQAGIPPRAEIRSVDQAKYYLDLGVRHFCIGYDLLILHQVMKDQGEGLRSVMEQAGRLP